MRESLKGDLRAVSVVLGPVMPCATIPVGVEDGGSVAAEERELVGRPAALINGDDGKGATAAGFPVDRDVFGVGLGG